MNADELAKAADFGVRFIPLVIKLREARDKGTGINLSSEEVLTLIEVMNILRRKETS